MRRMWCAGALGLALASGAAFAQTDSSATHSATGASSAAAPATSKKAGTMHLSAQAVVLQTAQGTIVIKLMDDAAPKTCANFVKLVKEGFYDGTYFHRVIPGFMIQGGDPNTKNPETPSTQYGTGGNGTNKLKAEFNDISHKRGIVSMARSSDPNSASSQFFIVVKDSPFLDNQYTVFGEVISGMDIADKIATAPRGANDRPNTPVHIKKVILSQAKSTS